jgi:hypothetical protein
MMFVDVVRRSAYGTTGYLAGQRDLDVLQSTIMRNLPLLRTFRQVIVATNYAQSNSTELMVGNADLWRRYLPDCVILDSQVNRGHSIGTSDLDNMLFDYCKASGIDWLCKGSNDVLLDSRLLEIPVDDAGFYYLNAVSYRMLQSQDFDLSRFGAGHFFPQTTFYAIDVSATDHLVDKEFLDRSWRIVNRIPDYNGRIWEHIPGWSCEQLLRQCVLRNRLKRESLMSQEQFLRVLQIVMDNRLEDCSLKGLSINGICHAQGYLEPDAVLTVVE